VVTKVSEENVASVFRRICGVIIQKNTTYMLLLSKKKETLLNPWKSVKFKHIYFKFVYCKSNLQVSTHDPFIMKGLEVLKKNTVLLIFKRFPTSEGNEIL
jgi:hypothetical protein